jgi:hypothetical protein
MGTACETGAGGMITGLRRCERPERRDDPSADALNTAASGGD